MNGESIERQRRWVAVLLLAGLAGAAFFAVRYVRGRDEALGKVTVSRFRFTPPEDDGGNLESIDRTKSSEVFFRVTLDSAPLGRHLDMSCDWSDPSGTVVHRNRYETRSIDKPIWTTWCRNQFGPASPIGTWSVTMSLEERPIATGTLQVRGGAE